MTGGGSVMVVERLDSPKLYLGYTVAENVPISNPDEVLRSFTPLPGIEAQFMDPMKIAGRWHLRLAAVNAVKAFKKGANISRRLSTEIMLYASGQRQIDKAFNMLGIKKGIQDVLILALGEGEGQVTSYIEEVVRRLGVNTCPEKIEKWSKEKIGEIIEEYGITKEEIRAVMRKKEGLPGAIERIVLERVALLSI